ncbi:nucleoside triphosphate pyrophosphohydrolase ham1 [Gurleya vavrai]
MLFKYVSTNLNKFKEFSSLFPYKIEQEKLEILEIQGTSEEIAHAKAKKAFKMLQNIGDDSIVIVDNVSLEISALNNFPGPYIKYFTKIGLEKIKKIMDCFDDKKAVAICSIGLCYKDKNGNLVTKVISEKVNGHLQFERQIVNENAFGFDFYFVPEPFWQTFAEMEFKEKNVISHRGKAVMKLIKYIEENLKDLIS